jgi:competence protein ComEC
VRFTRLVSMLIPLLIVLAACNPVTTVTDDPTPPDNLPSDSPVPSDPPPSSTNPLPVPTAGTLRISFLNVGQGDSVLIQTPDGKSALYDAGRYKDLAATLVQARGVSKLDLVIASHADADHIAGFKPDFFLNNGVASSTLTSANVIAAMTDAGAQGLVASERTINLGSSVALDVLPPAANAPASDQNANSVGVLVRFGSFRAFLGGDSTSGEEAS